MKSKIASPSLDPIGHQFWNSVSDGEKRNWPKDSLESVYAWFRQHLPLAGDAEVTEIDVHDDATYVSVLSIDCPFIIDSLTALVQRYGYSIVGLVHPVFTDESLKRPMSLVSMRPRPSWSKSSTS